MKTWTLTLKNQPLTLALASGRGACFGCLQRKEIRVISQLAKDFRRKFCQTCALERLSELKEHKISEELISEVRSSLIFGK
ncbi:MAG: hypothetical protein I3273_04210 [Candidatus Moeniiplasma glomeromycotorum]|nr:hypothetical protein [Candidatus Moeniiplasma glomeromycotorum]